MPPSQGPAGTAGESSRKPKLRRSQRCRTWHNVPRFETLEKRLVLDGVVASLIPETVVVADSQLELDVAQYFTAQSQLQFSALAADIQLQQLADGLANPVQIASVDDGSGRIFVVEQTGQIRILRRGDPGPDHSAPQVSYASASATHSDAVIAWTSNEATIGYVEYGTTTELGRTSSLTPTLEDYHRTRLVDLTPQTQYFFQVVALDAAGNATRSQPQSFTTGSVPASGEVLYNGIVLPQQWPPPATPTQEHQVAPYLVTPPEVINIDVGRQLFVDDFLIEQTTLQRSAHRPQFYHANPVLAPGDLPDSRNFAMPNSDGVWFDDDDGLFKMWYMGARGNTVSYAYSTDGVNWVKPQLPDSVHFPDSNTVLSLGGGRNSTTVWMDPLAADPNRKFQVFAYKSPQSLHIWYSPDGIHWTKDNDKTIPAFADRSTVFYNPFRQVWVSSLRKEHTLPAAGDRETYRPRTRSYAESPDLTHFTPSQFWTGPDVLDPIYYEPYGEKPELYNLDAVAYESVLVGLFSIWNPGAFYFEYDDPGPRVNEINVGFSRDGYHWDRPTRGAGDEAFIPASNNPNTWNGYNTQSAGGGFLVVGDELWFYFSGRTLKKPQFGEMSTGLAKLRRDGFYSMDAADGEGTLTTRPLTFSGEHLFVNVDNPSGQLLVEVIDLDGNVIAPFSKANSIPISADQTLVPVQWNGANDLSSLSGTPVRFRFHLTAGELYSFWVSDSPTGASAGYVAAGGPGLTGPVDTVGTAGYTPSSDATNAQNERVVEPFATTPAHLQPNPFLDLSNQVQLGFGRGVQSIAFHPQFDQIGSPGEGKLYVFYSAPATLGGDHDSVLSEFQVSATDPDTVDPASERELLRLNQPVLVSSGASSGEGFPLDETDQRRGGGLAFGPDDGLLYVTTGGEPGDAQNLGSLLGKVLRIDVNGSNGPTGRYGIPSSNPFVEHSATRGEIYAYGFHDPRHISFDDGTNGADSPDRLFVTDIGSLILEEVNLVVAGGNYGWDYREGTQSLRSGAPANLIEPIAIYPKSGFGEAVIGGGVYRGSSLPGWNGRYLGGDTVGQFKSFSVGSGISLVQTRATLGDTLVSVASLDDDVYVTTPNAVLQVTISPAAVPDWLSLNSQTGVFSGTPTSRDVGTTSIEVVATDSFGDRVTGTFDLTVVHNAPPLVTISATEPVAAEPANDGAFTITRSGNASLPLTVHYVVTGDATPNTDYKSIGSSITLPVGVYSLPLPVTVIDESETEAPERVTVTLAANPAYALSSSNSATVTIYSDEAIPTINVLITDGSASEPDDDGQLTLSRSGNADQPLTVYFNIDGTATEGIDYDSIGTSAIFPAGSASVDIPIQVRDNAQFESQETVTFTLADSHAYVLGSTASVTLAIDDDDVPVLTDGLAGHWTFNDSSGATAMDDSGSDHHGMLEGDPTWTFGPINGALRFDGLDDSVNVGSGPAIIGTGGFAVAAWIRTTAATDQIIVQQRSPVSHIGEYVLQMRSSGRAYFWTYGGGLRRRVESSHTLNDGRWHHVLGVRENDGTLKLYVDGVLDRSTSGSPSPLAELAVYIGADKRDERRFFAGEIDDVRIYARPLLGPEAALLATPAGSPVQAANDQFNGDEETIINISAAELLSNDIGNDLTISTFDSQSQLGLAITRLAGGGVRYNPSSRFDHLAIGESVVDRFAYSVTDGVDSDSASITITINGRNDQPTAIADVASTSEDAGVTIKVLDNDSDVDQTDVLSIIEVDNAATAGTVALVDHSIWYSPNGQFDSLAPGQTGFDTFQYTISDRNGGSATAIAVVTISGVNDPPMATDKLAWTDAATPVTVNVMTGNSDVDSSTLNLTAVNIRPGLGAVSINPDNTISYDPKGQLDHLRVGQWTIIDFSYTIADDSGATATAVVWVPVAGVGSALVAVDDAVSTDEKSRVAIPVLRNDLGDAEFWIDSVHSTSTIGTVTAHSDGTITYDPNGGFTQLAVGETATDTFSYTIVDDEGGTNTAQVTVTVNGINDLPQASSDAAATDERTQITIDVLAGDTDPDLSDVLTVVTLDDQRTTGAVALNPDGTVTYDPNSQFDHLLSGQTATDSFVYVVSDGHGGIAGGTVLITVNGLDTPPPLQVGLLAHWPLDDRIGPTAADASGNNHTGTLHGTPFWISGNLDGALEFDGEGDYVDAGMGPVVAGTGGFTVAAWVRVNSTGNHVIVQQRSTLDHNGQYGLEVASSGNVHFYTFGDNQFGPRITSSQSIRDGRWHHVAAVREDDGRSKIYIDGVVKANQAGAPRTLVPINVYLGADRRGAGSKFLDGSLDDVRVYDRALDQDQVLDLYQFRPVAALDVAALGVAALDVGGFAVLTLPRRLATTDAEPSVAPLDVASNGTLGPEFAVPDTATVVPSIASAGTDKAIRDLGFLRQLIDDLQMIDPTALRNAPASQ